jgi:hypothetical protein
MSRRGLHFDRAPTLIRRTRQLRHVGGLERILATDSTNRLFVILFCSPFWVQSYTSVMSLFLGVGPERQRSMDCSKVGGWKEPCRAITLPSLSMR